jgi:hypothetical protein
MGVAALKFVPVTLIVITGNEFVATNEYHTSADEAFPQVPGTPAVGDIFLRLPTLMEQDDRGVMVCALLQLSPPCEYALSVSRNRHTRI